MQLERLVKSVTTFVLKMVTIMTQFSAFLKSSHSFQKETTRVLSKESNR
jgi:hypothetical protein